MTTKTIPLEEASRDQLKAFAETILGLPIFAHNVSKANLLAAISQAGYEKQTVTIEEVEEVAPPAKAEKAAPAQPASGKKDSIDPTLDEMVQIVIPNQGDDVAGKSPVWVAVNGRGLWIERGKPSWVKRKYVNVLLQAVQTIYNQERDGTMISTDVPSYSFSIISDPARHAA